MRGSEGRILTTHAGSLPRPPALVDLAHGVYSSFSTPLAPWTGRLEAVRYRRYLRFLRRSQGRQRCVGTYRRPPRVTLRETLGRKRRILGRDG